MKLLVNYYRNYDGKSHPPNLTGWLVHIEGGQGYIINGRWKIEQVSLENIIVDSKDFIQKKQ